VKNTVWKKVTKKVKSFWKLLYTGKLKAAAGSVKKGEKHYQMRELIIPTTIHS